MKTLAEPLAINWPPVSHMTAFVEKWPRLIVPLFTITKLPPASVSVPDPPDWPSNTSLTANVPLETVTCPAPG